MNRYTFLTAIIGCVILSANLLYSQDAKEGIQETDGPTQIQSPQEVPGVQDVEPVQNEETAAPSSDLPMNIQTDAVLPAAEKTATTLEPKPNKVVSPKRSAPTVDQLRQEAKNLRDEAKILLEKAEKFKHDTDNSDNDIDDLEDLADDLENEAEKLLKQAFELQTCIRSTEKQADQPLPDSIVVRTNERGDSVTLDKRVLMEKMRTSADELLAKAREISVQVREMRESSSTKEDLADKFEEKADEFKEKADELDVAADNLEEEQNTEVLSRRFPFVLGHHIRFSAVPPFDDEDLHLLWLSGLRFGWYFTKWFSVSIDDVTLRMRETIDGTRTAITASPAMSFSHFFGKRCEVGSICGAAIQGQVGADRRYAVSVAPFCKLINQNWVTKHFSIGPVCSFNVVASGDFFARVIPGDHAGVLPDGAWWMDCGIAYTFHF